MLGGQDVLGQVVELDGTITLKVVFKFDGGGIRGTVEKGAGTEVIVISDTRGSVKFAWPTECDANGGFAMPDLPPGEYTMLAYRGTSDITSPEFQAVLAAGERVKVEAGAVLQIDLK